MSEGELNIDRCKLNLMINDIMNCIRAYQFHADSLLFFVVVLKCKRNRWIHTMEDHSKLWSDEMKCTHWMCRFHTHIHSCIQYIALFADINFIIEFTFQRLHAYLIRSDRSKRGINKFGYSLCACIISVCTMNNKNVLPNECEQQQ